MLMLKLLTDTSDILEAYKSFRDAAYCSDLKQKKKINFKGGGGGEGKVCWYPELRLWSYLKRRKKMNDSWNIFGIQNPNKYKCMAPDCEINTPFQSNCWVTAGAFAHDEHDRTFVVHSGRIGGGKPGIGKSAFWRLYTGEPAYIERSKKQPLRVAVVTILDEPDTVARLAQFVWMVAWIKATVTIEQMRKKKDATDV